MEVLAVAQSGASIWDRQLGSGHFQPYYLRCEQYPYGWFYRLLASLPASRVPDRGAAGYYGGKADNVLIRQAFHGCSMAIPAPPAGNFSVLGSGFCHLMIGRQESVRFSMPGQYVPGSYR